MWRITGGILLFNVIRHITHAIRDLIGVVFDFEEAMYNVNSVAQLDAKALAKLNDQVITLALDPRIRDGPAMLAAGLYTIASSGYEAKDALIVLEQAALASTAGMTTTAVAADVLVSTLGAYNLGVGSAVEVTNQLFQIVNISKYTFEDLASALDSVTPTAAALGIGLNEIGAALAVFAKRGVDAQTATVQMNAILSAMLKPTTEMTAALHSLGYETGQEMIAANGFVGTMKIWAAVVGEDADMASALFGDVRALRGEMNLVNDGAVELTKNLALMNKAQDDGGAMSRALAEQMKSNAFQIDVFQKNLQVLAVLGFGMIAPYLNKALVGINTFVSGSITAFRHFRDKGYSIFDALRAAIKKTLQMMFGSDVVTPVLKFFDDFVNAFYTIKGVVILVWPILRKMLSFLVDHFNILGPAILGAVVALKAFNIVTAVSKSNMAGMIKMLVGLPLPLLIIMALGALLAVAWTKNWGDIQGKTKVAVEFIGKWLGKIWVFIRPVVMAIVELGRYLKAVATGDIRPFGEELKKLPGWIQPIAFVLGRVVKTLRVFFKVWQDRGFLAAIKTIPVQIRAFGRAISMFFESMGLKKFSVGLKALFYDVARLFGHVVDLVDDVVHGRWKEAWEDLGNIAIDLFWIYIDNLRTQIAFIADVFGMIPWKKIGLALLAGFIIVLDYVFTTIIPWLAITGAHILVGLYDAIVEYWNDTISPWFSGLIDIIQDYFKDAGSWLKQTGNDILGGMWDGITFAWDWGWAWFRNIMDWIKNAFLGAPYVLWQVGAELVMGLWNGIVWAWNWMTKQLSLLWASLPEWMKKLWGIMSPSKVFAKIGKEIPAGLVVGIKSGMGEVEKSISRMGLSSSPIRSARYSSRLPSAPMALAGSSSRRIVFEKGSIIVNGAQGQNETILAEKVASRILRESDNYRAGQK